MAESNALAPSTSSPQSVCQRLDQREFGGAEGIRTLDLLDAIEARSQLRHGPTEPYQFNIFATGQICAEMSEGSCNPIFALQVQLNAEQ